MISVYLLLDYVSMFVDRGCESLENSLVRYMNLTVI